MVLPMPLINQSINHNYFLEYILLRQCPPFGCEDTIAKLYSYMESSK